MSAACALAVCWFAVHPLWCLSAIAAVLGACKACAAHIRVRGSQHAGLQHVCLRKWGIWPIMPIWHPQRSCGTLHACSTSCSRPWVCLMTWAPAHFHHVAA